MHGIPLAEELVAIIFGVALFTFFLVRLAILFGGDAKAIVDRNVTKHLPDPEEQEQEPDTIPGRIAYVHHQRMEQMFARADAIRKTFATGIYPRRLRNTF